MDNLPEGYTYRPLPDSVTIKSSYIEGLGLYAVLDIDESTILGISHVQSNQELFRLPLGGFINHSLEPNAKITDNIESRYYLQALTRIPSNTEITVNYFKAPCGINGK